MSVRLGDSAVSGNWIELRSSAALENEIIRCNACSTERHTISQIDRDSDRNIAQPLQLAAPEAPGLLLGSALVPSKAV